MSEPAGLSKLNRTKMQIDGDESKHLPQVRDAVNGFLDTPTANSAESSIIYAPLPGEATGWKQRNLALLRQLDQAKARRANQ